MIERIAKAIYEYAGDDTWRAKNCEVRPYKDMAIAAIKAMREPTQNMITKGIDTGGKLGWGCYYTNYKNVYQSMIDAIINE